MQTHRVRKYGQAGGKSFSGQKILERDLLKLCRFDLDRWRGRGSLGLGGVVIASMGMTTVETPPHINNAVSTWNALQVQEARGSLITLTDLD